MKSRVSGLEDYYFNTLFWSKVKQGKKRNCSFEKCRCKRNWLCHELIWHCGFHWAVLEASLCLCFTENANILFFLFCLYSWRPCHRPRHMKLTGFYSIDSVKVMLFLQILPLFLKCYKVFWVKKILKNPTHCLGIMRLSLISYLYLDYFTGCQFTKGKKLDPKSDNEKYGIEEFITCRSHKLWMRQGISGT